MAEHGSRLSPRDVEDVLGAAISRSIGRPPCGTLGFKPHRLADAADGSAAEAADTFLYPAGHVPLVSHEESMR